MWADSACNHYTPGVRSEKGCDGPRPIATLLRMLGEIDPGAKPYYESPVFNFIDGYLSASFGNRHIFKGHRVRGQRVGRYRLSLILRTAP